MYCRFIYVVYILDVFPEAAYCNVKPVWVYAIKNI